MNASNYERVGVEFKLGDASVEDRAISGCGGRGWRDERRSRRRSELGGRQSFPPRYWSSYGGDDDRVPSQAALQRRFNLLSHRHSNHCALRPQDVSALASSRRLQGSCCTAMVYEHYVKQIRGLTAYRSIPQIPRDPYDISVAQAKELLGYDRSIQLTPSEKGAYRRAMKLASEHGPCCCQCWRWSTFGGQAKYLMTRRGWSPAAIAEVWDLEDGCGGKG